MKHVHMVITVLASMIVTSCVQERDGGVEKLSSINRAWGPGNGSLDNYRVRPTESLAAFVGRLSGVRRAVYLQVKPDGVAVLSYQAPSSESQPVCEVLECAVVKVLGGPIEESHVALVSTQLGPGDAEVVQFQEPVLVVAARLEADLAGAVVGSARTLSVGGLPVLACGSRGGCYATQVMDDGEAIVTIPGLVISAEGIWHDVLSPKATKELEGARVTLSGVSSRLAELLAEGIHGTTPTVSKRLRLASTATRWQAPVIAFYIELGDSGVSGAPTPKCETSNRLLYALWTDGTVVCSRDGAEKQVRMVLQPHDVWNIIERSRDCVARSGLPSRSHIASPHDNTAVLVVNVSGAEHVLKIRCGAVRGCDCCDPWKELRILSDVATDEPMCAAWNRMLQILARSMESSGPQMEEMAEEVQFRILER